MDEHVAEYQRDAAALILAACWGDDEGLAAVARNLADPAATAVQLAGLIACAVDWDPEAAAELAAELQRRTLDMMEPPPPFSG